MLQLEQTVLPWSRLVTDCPPIDCPLYTEGGHATTRADCPPIEQTSYLIPAPPLQRHELRVPGKS